MQRQAFGFLSSAFGAGFATTGAGTSFAGFATGAGSFFFSTFCSAGTGFSSLTILYFPAAGFSATGSDGFSAGFDGWEEADPPLVYPFSYKSIEHNIDAYAVFGALYGATAEAKYYEAAKSAENFILSMYNEEKGCFMTGTLEDGITPNESVTVLDAQVWCAMAKGDSFKDYEKALSLVDQMKTPEGGYPFCQENRNGGWWAEGTAFTALMFRGRGEISRYREAMDALCGIQLESGLFPAATNDHLSTGMELFDGSPWEYSTDPHTAPTAWFVMAANGFNPYVFPDIN